MNPVRIADATAEALTLAEVKEHLRIVDNDDDAWVTAMIPVVRKVTENHLRATIMAATWEYKLDCFAPEILLPMAPVDSITSIKYIDDDGIEQTLAVAEYQFDNKGRLKPAYDKSWPSTRRQLGAVTVTYVAGVTTAAEVDQDIKLAMKLWIGHYDLNRENVAFTQVSEIPNGARDLLSPHRNWKP